MSSQIKQFFSGQTVFITGGSGFLGKLFIEKLLRECDIRRIYVLMRPKKNKSPEERFAELFNYACFDVLKSQNPDALRKVSLVNGDCKEQCLGLSDDDLKILFEETTCVIHAAANVKFEQTLKEASYNVQATRDVVELAKQMKKLRVFVYISTAFSNCITTDVKEEFNKPPMKVENLLTLVNAVDDETLNAITPHVLEKWPNTYVYTKCISEDVVKRAAQELPLVVMRPAIVTSTAEEPVPGWIDNFYGAVGIASAAGLGAIRTLYGKVDAVAPIVPADYVINCTLAAAWYREKSGTTGLYQYSGHKSNILTWRKFTDIIYRHRYNLTPSVVVWHYTFKIRENETWNRICQFFLHTVNAYIADFVLFCLRRPTIAVKAYERLNKMLNLLSYFASKSWNFENENATMLWDSMNDEDQKLFFFNMEKLDWYKYGYTGGLGARIHLFKESLDTLPQARRKMKMLFVAHYATVVIFWYLVYKLVMFALGCFF